MSNMHAGSRMSAHAQQHTPPQQRGCGAVRQGIVVWCSPHCLLSRTPFSSSRTGSMRTPRAAPVQASRREEQQEPGTDTSPPIKTPWRFGFQCNERFLSWDESAQVALVKIWLAEQLAVTVPQVEEQLADLANLLPDLVQKMERARADVLLELLRDPPATAARLLALRELLPRCNVSALVAGHPKLLLSLSVQEVGAKVAELRERLRGVDVDALIQQEPMLLRADLPRLMSELARLAPAADPVALIVADPQIVLDMDVAGMPSTLEMDGAGL